MTTKKRYLQSTNPATDYKVIAVDYKEWSSRLLKQVLRDEATIERLRRKLKRAQ